MTVEIHNLREEFLEEIDVIERDSFKTPWSKDAYREETENPNAVYKVLTVNGEVVAYGGFWQIFDEGHITNIAVKRERRKQGLGDILVQALISEAEKRGIFSLTLEVRESNIPAQRLYQKHNFKSVGVRPKYYPDGEGAVIMWRN